MEPANAGGYWHILDAEGNVVGVPSDEATDVKVVSSTH
jgi:hypothetical protein